MTNETGYTPSSEGEKRFVKKHIVRKIEDRNEVNGKANGDDVFKASNIKQVKRFAHGHGYDDRDDAKVYEETNLEERNRSKEELLNKWQEHITSSVESSQKAKTMGPLFKKYHERKAQKHMIAAKLASNMMKEEDELLEMLSPENPMAKWIEDFIKSKSARLEGKSKSERVEAAKAAYYAAKRKSVTEQAISEGLRLIRTHGSGEKIAKVYKDNEWGEHRVKFYTDGKHHKDADYHTDDAEDAHDTAALWASSKKPVKEEEDLQELSNQTVISYLNKRGDSIKNSEGSDKQNNLRKANRVNYMKALQRNYKKEEEKPVENPKVHDLSHMSHGDAYDHSQTSHKIKDGDVLKLKGGHTAIMNSAWPTMAHGLSKVMHHLKPEHNFDNYMGGKYKKSMDKVREIHGLKEEKDLQELSKQTLGSYISKASKDAKYNGYMAGDAEAKADAYKKARASNREYAQKVDDKAHKRLKGIDTAVKKLTKEDAINRTVDKFVKEEVTQDKLLSLRIADLSESYQNMILEHFSSLSDSDKAEFVSSIKDQDGLNEALDSIIMKEV